MEITTNENVDIVDTICKENTEVTCGGNSYDESVYSGRSDYEILDEHN